MFKERGELLLLKFADRLKDVGALESMPKLEGKRMHVMFAPKAQKKKGSGSDLGKLIDKEKLNKQPAEPAEPAAPKPGGE